MRYISRFVFINTLILLLLIECFPQENKHSETVAITDSTLDNISISPSKPTIRDSQGIAVQTISSVQIKASPFRDIREIVSSAFGLLQDRKYRELKIRGGSIGETGYIIDDIWVNDPLTGYLSPTVSKNSLEEIQFLPAGYSAEFGNAMGGIVKVTTKSGKQNYFGSVEYVADELFGNGMRGLRSSGSSLWNLSLGGPVIPTKKELLQFFGSFEYNFERDPNPSYYSENLRNIANSIWPKFKEVTVNYIEERLRNQPRLEGAELDRRASELLLDQTNWNISRPGQMPNGSQRRFAWNEKLTMNLGDLKITLAGISSRTKSRIIEPGYLLMNSFHNPLTLQENDQYIFKTAWSPQPSTFIDGQISYYRSYAETMDPIHEDRVFDYGDPEKNPLFRNYFPPGIDPSRMIGSRIPMDTYINYFALPGRVYDNYGKNKTIFWQFNANLTQQIGDHEIKIGGEYKIHDLRQYTITPLRLAFMPDSLQEIIKQNPDLLTEAQRTYVFREYQYRVGNTYGYDYFGREVSDEGYNNSKKSDGPKKPILGSAYIQDKIALQDFVLNFGLRFDYWNSNTEVLKDFYDFTNSKNTQLYESPERYMQLFPGKPVPTEGWGNPNIIEDDSFEKSKPIINISPRLSLAYSAQSTTTLFAKYGSFYQTPPLQYLYVSQDYLRNWYVQPGYVALNNPKLHPEKTTQYELGILQQLGEVASAHFTAYYKKITGLIQYEFIQSIYNKTTYAIFQNGDGATVRGFDFTIDQRRWNNFSSQIHYTYSAANGNYEGHNMFGNNLSTRNYSINFTLNLDYRFDETHNNILDNFGINLLFRANRNRAYDTQASNTFSNHYNWNKRFDLKIDKTFQLPYGINLNAYLICLNVLNSIEIISVWPTTGDPDNSGANLDTIIRRLVENGRASEVPVYTGLYKMYESQPDNVGSSRQIRLGIALEL
ncbi:MAG: TonB-dependent receptor [Bacteroidota bacterium]|nr:TonB-dependent receptor [Bacteroidota bacterium]